MKIAEFEVKQNATSQYVRLETQKTQIAINVQPPRQMAPVTFTPVEETQEVSTPYHLSEEDEAKIRLLERLIEALTGKKFKFSQVFKALKEKATSPPPQTPNFSIRIEQSHEIAEEEKMSYQSEGVVRTSDGKEIAFNLNLQMSRAYYESSKTQIQIGSPLQDPLVLNLDAPSIGFTGESIEIDIDMDGKLDNLPILSSGNAYLTLDQNQNGIIDNGSELFGPTTGSGFSELRAYDDDQNGWIDENDSIFNKLTLWSVNQNGEKTLIGLKEAGVGAIFLSYTASPFHFKNGDETFAKIKSTGTYLKENGEARTLHEIDLKL